MVLVVTVRPRPSRQVRQTRRYVGVRFLLERGFRFRNLGFFADMI
jgi:hypothetical protein